MKKLPMPAPLPGLEDIQESFVDYCSLDKAADRCAPIDARITQLVNEFVALSKERTRLEKSGDGRRLSQVVRQMDINRDLRLTLHRLRWKNT